MPFHPCRTPPLGGWGRGVYGAGTHFVRRKVVAVGHSLVELADVGEVGHKPSGAALRLLAVEHQILFGVLFVRRFAVVVVVVLLVHRRPGMLLDFLRRRFPVEQRHYNCCESGGILKRNPCGRVRGARIKSWWLRR